MGPAFSRKYGVLLVTGTTAIRIPIIKRAVVDYAVGADWSPAAGDVKVNIDGAGPANITNLPTAVASGNGAYWEFILTAAELTSKQSIVTIVDAATKAIEDQCFSVETYGNASAMYAADLSAANLPANVTQLLGTAWLTPGVAGTPDINLKLWAGVAPNALQQGKVDGAFVIRANTATAGSASTITLDAGASSTNGIYAWDIITIISGTGAGQSRLISAYNGGTLVATVTPNWSSNPSGTSVFVITPFGAANVQLWNNAALVAPNVAGVPVVDPAYWNGTAVSAPATAGIPEINVKNINNISAAAVTTIKAIIGLTVADTVALSAAGVQAIWDALTSALTTVGSIGKLLVTNIDAAISSRLSSAGYTTPPTAVQNRQEMDSNSTKLANLDATISSRTKPADTQARVTLVDTATAVTNPVGVTSNVKKNQALAKFPFLMTDSTNHNPATGKTVTVTRSIDGGAQAAGTLVNVTEVSNGSYTVDFGAGDLNGNAILLRATAAGCDDTFERVITQP